MSLKSSVTRSTTTAPPATSSTPATSQYPSTKLGQITARVSKKSLNRIRELAFNESTTVQSPIVEWLSTLFVERGLEPLEEVNTDHRRAADIKREGAYLRDAVIVSMTPIAGTGRRKKK